MSNSNTINNSNPINDNIPDANYLDENFINLLNSISNENFNAIFIHLIENYSAVASQSDFNQFSKLSLSEINSEIAFNNFYRQIKYLINKGVYLRLSKKFLMELINLGFSEEKVNLIRDIQKANLDKLLNLINKSEKDSNNNSIKGLHKIIDVEVKTEMPSYNTNYETFKAENGNSDNYNEDIKKQNVYLNLKLDKKHFGENNFINNNNNNSINNSLAAGSNEIGLFQNLNVKMNKVQLAAFYAEIEKIQESLDKLC